MAKKGIIRTVFGCLFLILCFGLISCGKTENNLSTVTLTLDKEELTISQYKNGWLFADYDGDEGIVWSSDSENVATVYNGKVVGVGVGTAVITATVGNVIDECRVTVTAADPEKFAMTAKTETFTKYAGDKVETDFTLTYDGVPVNRAMDYIIEDLSVAEVSDAGAITMKAIGETTVTATVEIEGKTLTAFSFVKVIPDYSVKIGKGIPTLYPYANYDGVDYVNSTGVNVLVYYKGELKNEEANVDLSVDQNQDVLLVSGNKITAKNAGETLLTASYTYDGITVLDTVTVKVAAIKTLVNKTLDVGIYGGWAADFNALGLSSNTVITAAALTADGVTKDLRIEENVVYFDGIEAKKGTLSLTSRNFAFEFPVAIWNALIADVKGMEALKTATTGRYKFVADIDMTGVLWASTAAFKGTVEGGGHTISNFKTSTGLFNVFNGGTIQNLALTDVVVVGVDRAGIIASGNDRSTMTAITADNLYVSIAQTETTYYLGVFGYYRLRANGLFTMTNSVVINNTKSQAAVIGRVSESAITLTNCYLINTKGYLAVQGGAADSILLPSTNTAYSYEDSITFKTACDSNKISGLSNFILSLLGIKKA